jgi:crotonobetainyl-CoA:carnitine CoA-transferase CaiB-like acyl-CoA transferase
LTQPPLNNVKILDLTHVWAGPLAVRFLSDLGAEVIKIEAPFGRGPREYPSEPLGGWIGGASGTEPWNVNALFVKLHRNRKSVCLDLKQRQARKIFLELVAMADVVVENFSARAMPSMGLDYEALRLVNEKIIYLSMPGYGMSGPYRDRVAFGPTVEPLSGLTRMLGYGPTEPRNSAMALMDPIAAKQAAAAVTEALMRRNETGAGCLIEISLHEGGVTYSGPWLVDEQLGNMPHCIGNRHPEMAPHGTYPSKGEDQWISIACKNDDQFSALCNVIGYRVASKMSLAERIQAHDEIDEMICAWSAMLTNQQATERLQRQNIAAGPVNAAPDIVADEQVIARQFFVPYERFGTPIPGYPIQMGGIRRDTWTRCPSLGEHNREVLSAWLKYDDERIRALENDGILVDAPPT